MKIIGIIGSPRGRNSYTLKVLESALEGAREAGFESSVIDVTRFHINYCKGCSSCYKTGHCVLDDDFLPLFEQLLNADGIILASPVYFGSVTAQLKTFIDRCSFYRHCFLLNGKYGASITTTASSGAPETIDLMNQYIINLGAFTVGSMAIVQPAIPENMKEGLHKAHALGKDIAEAIMTRRDYPEQTAIRKQFLRTFKHVVAFNQKQWKAEYEHYVKQGWIR